MRLDFPSTNSPDKTVGTPGSMVQRWIIVWILCSLTVIALGCGRGRALKKLFQGQPHCDQLVRAACARLEEQSDGPERCEQLKLLAESVDDDQCKENLRILKESGKLQSQ